MSTIFGAIGVNDGEYVFNLTQGQRVVYELASQYVAEQNAALNLMLSTFVEETTSDYKRRYKLPGGGMLQKRGGQAQSGAVKAYGGWDVALPLNEYGDQIGGTDVEFAYMTAADLQRHLDTVTARNINTVRYEALKALFTNTQTSFVDERLGTLTVEPLANGDAVVYPPVPGTSTEATDNHYLASGYLSSAISDTNDPFATIVPELEEHFGQPTGGSPIVTFINVAQVPKVSNLAALVQVQDNYVNPSALSELPILPPSIPGKVIGRHQSGTWAVQWDWIPADYCLAIHLGAPKPLAKRVDPAATGLATDLALVANDDEFPFRTAHWRHRFGLGVFNRLNGVIMKFTAGGYTIPTAYA